MGSNKLEECMNKLDALVQDEDKIVTYKYLSRTFNIHVNTAKQLLQEYLKKQKSVAEKSVSACYLLAGSLKDGSYIVSIVSEKDLERAFTNLDKITSVHVYSVQKCKDLSLWRNHQMLYVVDAQLGLPQNYPIKFSKCQGVKVKTEVEDIVEYVEPKEVFEEEKMKAVAKNLPKKSTKENSEVMTAVTVPEKRKKEKETVERSPGKKESALTDWMRFKNMRERKRKRIVCDNDESESDENLSETETVSEPEISVKADVNEESGEGKSIQGTEEESELGEADNIRKRKKIKKKIIDQTFLLDDGYMETVKKIVYVTDSDEEEHKAKTEDNANTLTSAQMRNDERTKKMVHGSKGEGTKKQQSTLLSFFKRT